MIGSLVLIGLFVWVLWLWYRDVKEQETDSSSVNLVVIWALLYGSRPVTSWFSANLTLPEARDQGNPVEATINLALIIVGLCVLWGRRLEFRQMVGSNRGLVLFYLFWLASIMWSDYPLITVKRLVKDLGNLVMVLIVLSDRSPGEAIRVVMTRCAYVCLPASIWLIRYYPSLGRNYVGYDLSEPSLTGVTENKNALGALALISVLFVFWDILQRPQVGSRLMAQAARASRLCILGMGWYLLFTVDSATSLVCAAMGSVLLFLLRARRERKTFTKIEAGAIASLIVLGLADWLTDLRRVIVESLGRDLTLTSRTDIWPVLLLHQENQFIGAGFESFWAGHRLALLHDRLGGIIQAHNGYLETYLNGGWVGIGLLVGLLVWGYSRIRRAVSRGVPEGAMRLVIVAVAGVYNLSEASFNKMGLLWLVTLWAIMEYRRFQEPRPIALAARPVRTGRTRCQTGPRPQN